MPMFSSAFLRPVRLVTLVCATFVGSVLFASTANAAQGPVGLGTADSFAVLAGSGITNTGPTTITGDIGTFPTPSETGMGTVTLHGANNHGNAVTQGAKQDLTTAYNDAAGRGPVTSVATELGGTTLPPGVYGNPTLGLTGALTLDAQGDSSAQFIFLADSTLITASNSEVRLINGAQACNVVWKVGSSATFGTGTSFVGDVLSHTSITADTAATFQGRLLARGGAVTLDTNTITRSSCMAPVPTPTPTPTPKKSHTPTPQPTATSKPHSPSPKPTRSSRHAPSPGPTGGGSFGSPGGSHGPSGAGGGFGGGSGGLGSGHRTTTPMTSLPFTGLPTQKVIGGALALLGLGFLAVVIASMRRSDFRRHQN
jgi:cell division septation protein DedD